MTLPTRGPRAVADACVACLSDSVRTGPRRPPGGREPRQKSREDGRGCCEQQHRHADRRRFESRDFDQAEAQKERQPDDSQPDSHGPGQDGNEKALGYELPDQGRAPGAQGRPKSEFPAPRDALGQQQVGDVSACDEEHQSDGAHQGPEHRPIVVEDNIVNRIERGRWPIVRRIGYWIR